MQDSWICPMCEKPQTGHPALSRVDASIKICTLCSIIEALCAAGLPYAQAQQIVEKIARTVEKSDA